MRPTEFPDFGLTEAERHEAVFGHYFESPGMDGERGEIWCYTDRFSYRPGDKAEFKVSSTAPRFDIEIVRDGGVEMPAFSQHGIAAHWQETPEQCSVEGCGWETTFDLTIPDEWPSGAYRATLTAEGRDGKPIHSHHLFIVCPKRAKAGRILQIAATGTWTAYNTWGGSNHYQGITGPNRDQFATRVSTQRPWCRGFAVLPPDAPRVPLEIALPPMTEPRYPHMEWAYATGHSKKYTSAGWASYDSHFFKWAERSGYGVDLISQHELHFSPDILDGYDCIVCVGHDEYWTWEMRDTVDAYLEKGGHAARFAGNFLWQTRLEDGGRQQVCYKYRARKEDPVYASGDTSRATNAWEAPEVGRPGATTFGLSAMAGVYAGWGGCLPRGVRGFPIYRPEHWAFKGSGLYYGDVLGDESHIFGYEVDGLDHVICNGLPEPTGKDAAPAGVQILAVGLASQVEENADIPPGFLNDEDGRFTAATLYGEASDENLEKVKRGNGMIVNFSKGKGEVFHAGTCEWVAGLLRKDAMVEKVTRNVLDRYLGSSNS
ncbi:N,N-dimethylformamidase beta subunit family domain-containing protein [Arvimicrobium flavum]|uniref:N,N-dimethylformamidase beta subunit family domain-containing protein n=1 Tax=Arvimicrobium flavum TaxID=3393320 RepID=UPI00237C311B|nr:N,N-dimethylformamidase beta subunit family domain-containing protein [Mesorhizobium shangrilense]